MANNDGLFGALAGEFTRHAVPQVDTAVAKPILKNSSAVGGSI